MAAFAVDYGVILVYLGLLTLVGVLGRAVGAVPDDVATPAGRILAQLASFLVLTVPVSAWFAGWEASRGKATLGKRMLRLRVCTTSGGRLAWPRSLLRTGLKITLPWELAHTAVWNMLAWPGQRAAAADAVLLVLANAIIVVNLASLFVGSRRTPYDRIAGTVVVVSPRGQLDPASARSSGVRRSPWRLMAALMSPTWLKAWVKLPSRLSLAGSISSASSPGRWHGRGAARTRR